MSDTLETANRPDPTEGSPNGSRPAPAASAADAIDLLHAVHTGRRRRLGAMVLAFVIGAGAGALGWAVWDSSRGSTETTDAVVAQLTTVPAETRDLATFVEYSGTLGFSRSESVTSVLEGTFTAIPEAGVDLIRGDVIYEVDTEPVVVFYGDLPAWRDLDADSDDGRDIAQLEANLWALGYTVDLDDGNGPYLTVDGDYDWATAHAVELWETDLGVGDPDGSFELDRVVYLSGEVRVDDPATSGSLARTGSSVLTAVVTTTVTDVIDIESAEVTGEERASTERVTLEVATSEQEAIVLGEPVTIELADTRLAVGVVVEIGEVARRLGTGPNADLVVDVVVDVTGVPGGGLLEGPVTVRLIDESATAVTAVPVRALVALAEGGYAVEVESGTSRGLVGVEIGIFAEGWVEVTGVTPGDEVVVPS